MYISLIKLEKFITRKVFDRFRWNFLQNGQLFVYYKVAKSEHDRTFSSPLFGPLKNGQKGIDFDILVSWQAKLVLVLRDDYDFVFREYILVFCCFCLPCGLARPLIYIGCMNFYHWHFYQWRFYHYFFTTLPFYHSTFLPLHIFTTQRFYHYTFLPLHVFTTKFLPLTFLPPTFLPLNVFTTLHFYH